MLFFVLEGTKSGSIAEAEPVRIKMPVISKTIMPSHNITFMLYGYKSLISMCCDKREAFNG